MSVIINPSGGGGGGGSDTRTSLTADTTYYIATTGNDSTGDGSIGNPWATPQKAWNYVSTALDFENFNVTVQCADGVYSSSVINLNIVSQTWVGGGSLTFQGNLSDRTKVRWSTSDINVINLETSEFPGLFNFTNIQLVFTSSGGSVVFIQSVGQFHFFSCDISMSGAAASYDLSNSTTGQNVQIWGDYTILAASGGSHVNAGGTAVCVYIPTTVTAAGGGVTFDSFIFTDDLAWVQVNFLGAGPIGTFHGKRFTIDNKGLITASFTPGANIATYLPGDLPGTIDGDGTYRDSFGSYTKLGAVASNFNYLTPTTGATITLNNYDWQVILDPASALSSLFFTMCPVPFDGQIINVTTSQEISGLVVTPNAGQSVVGAPAILAAGGGFSAIYRAADTTWFCEASVFYVRVNSNLTFYVATTGSDSNPGTVSAPFATIAHAMNVVGRYDLQGIYTWTVQLADGTYLENNIPVANPYNGEAGGNVIGNIATVANVVIDANTVGGAQQVFSVPANTGANPFGLAIDGITATVPFGGRFIASNGPLAGIFLNEISIIGNNSFGVVDCSNGSGGGLLDTRNSAAIWTIAGTFFQMFSGANNAVMNFNNALVFIAGTHVNINFINITTGAQAEYFPGSVTGTITGNSGTMQTGAVAASNNDLPSDWPGNGVFRVDNTTQWGFFGQAIIPVSGQPTNNTQFVPAPSWLLFKDTTQADGFGSYIAVDDSGGSVAFLSPIGKYLVSALPAGLKAGTKAWATDAVAPVFATTLTGGGGVFCPVYYDGTNWRAG